MKVLVIDDSKMSQMVIHKFLKEIFTDDLEVKFAFSGEEGLNLFKSFKPDVCTVDIIMSGIDGIEATRQMSSDNSEIEVIIITSTDEKLENFQELPVIKAVINKPITLEKMKNAFARV